MNRQASRPVRRFLWAACAALWICAFVATHIPAKAVPRTGVGDVVLHFIGYFVLTSSLAAALIAQGLPGRTRVPLALATMVFYAALDELTQPLVGRSAAMSDFIANVLGAAAALVVIESAMLVVRTRRRARTARHGVDARAGGG